jgi:hypothetical protein
MLDPSKGNVVVKVRRILDVLSVLISSLLKPGMRTALGFARKG